MAHGLRGRGVLGDGLWALRHCVLGELSGEEAHGGLDLAASEGNRLSSIVFVLERMRHVSILIHMFTDTQGVIQCE